MDPGFQRVNRLFALSFENNAGQASYKRYYFPTVGIIDYNVMIYGRNFFNETIKNNLIIYENI